MKVHIALLIIILMLNIIPDSIINRKKIIMPFSFLLILVYWSFRYDYGLDYWNYYDLFYSRNIVASTRGLGEVLFYNVFLRIWKYYYQFVIAHSFIVIVSLYHMVRKYVPSYCYWLFFVLLLIIPSFHFNLISAMRSTLAACVLYWALDYCYIEKRRWLLYIGLVAVATLFHTSAITLIILPLFDFLFSHMKGRTIFILLVLVDLLSGIVPNSIFVYVVDNVEILSDYAGYSGYFGVSNYIGIIWKSIILLPAYFFCLHFKSTNNEKNDRVYILAFIFLVVEMLNLDFHGRYTVYLYLFFIIALAHEYRLFSSNQRLLVLSVYLSKSIYGLIVYYQTLLMKLNFEWRYGNMYYYHTIFQASQLP